MTVEELAERLSRLEEIVVEMQGRPESPPSIEFRSCEDGNYPRSGLEEKCAAAWAGLRVVERSHLMHGLGIRGFTTALTRGSWDMLPLNTRREIHRFAFKVERFKKFFREVL